MEADRPARCLPGDVVAIILQRLQPRDLAVSRSVCKTWCAVVDEGGMLRPDLLPLTLGGIFISLARQPAPPLLFAPPWTMGQPKIASRLESFVRMKDWWDIPTILGSSNGLLFLDDQVVNPATRQWAPVPTCPVGQDFYDNHGDVYFAFDPTLSPHYEVLYIHPLQDGLEDESEWPPSTLAMWIYSSGTGNWEEKTFVREGGPAGTVAEERAALEPEYRHAVCWRGALYAHCKNDFVMRITIPDYTYQVIKLPDGVSATLRFGLHLVKSKHGVYFVLVSDRCHLRVWFLNEFGGNTEWVLKYDIDLQVMLAHFSQDRDYPVDKPWILHDDGVYNENGNFEWDSDNDNVIEIEDTSDKCYSELSASIFGFHPFKEVVFLYLSNERVVACHLDSLKVQDLGQLHLPYRVDVIDTTFMYTPFTVELSHHI